MPPAGLGARATGADDPSGETEEPTDEPRKTPDVASIAGVHDRVVGMEGSRRGDQEECHDECGRQRQRRRHAGSSHQQAHGPRQQ